MHIMALDYVILMTARWQITFSITTSLSLALMVLWLKEHIGRNRLFKASNNFVGGLCLLMLSNRE